MENYKSIDSKTFAVIIEDLLARKRPNIQNRLEILANITDLLLEFGDNPNYRGLNQIASIYLTANGIYKLNDNCTE